MRWLLFAPEHSLLAKQCENFLQVAGQSVVEPSASIVWSLQTVKDQINQEKPDRIIVIVNDTQAKTLVKTITDHLLLPLYVAQATNTVYSAIPVLILGTNSDEQNLRIVQDATDQLIQMHPHVIK